MLAEWLIECFYPRCVFTHEYVYSLPSVSAQDFGLCSKPLSITMKRGLTLVCKIMQNIANRVATEKETYMRYFNDFFKTNCDAALK